MSSTSLTWTALRAIQEHFARVAVEHCNSGAEVSPQLFVIETDENGEVAKMAAVAPELVHGFFESPENKDLLAMFLKEMLTRGSPMRASFERSAKIKPTVLVQISEAWTLELSPEEQEHAMGHGHPQPSKDPARKECLMVILHTELGSIPTMHKIETAPTRHCVQSEFPGPATMDGFKGRFAINLATTSGPAPASAMLQ